MRVMKRIMINPPSNKMRRRPKKLFHPVSSELRPNHNSLRLRSRNVGRTYGVEDVEHNRSILSDAERSSSIKKTGDPPLHNPRDHFASLPSLTYPTTVRSGTGVDR